MTIWRPMTPFERRMKQLASLFPPPPSHPSHDLLIRKAEQLGEQDLSVRLWASEVAEKGPFFAYSRLRGGSQLPLSTILRTYFQEYMTRLLDGGPWALPVSFNVVEAFLKFSHDLFVFDIRKEHEHLVRLGDYLDWYTAGSFPEDPEVLKDLLPEGEVYAYNMAVPLNDYMVQTTRSKLALFGIAFVRHDEELSSLALLGESPPHVPDEDLKDKDFKAGYVPKGKEHLEPNHDLGISDRYLGEAPGYCRVIGLTRFDLSRRQFVVRHVQVDWGQAFGVYTDDPSIFPAEISGAERRAMVKVMESELERYTPAFSFMATLMYLPAFFIAEQGRVVEERFATQLQVERASSKVRKAVRLLGKENVPFFRKVSCCLMTSRPTESDEQVFDPPEMEFNRAGFWKTLPPGQAGEDQVGNSIVGKTWVERTDAWSSRGLESFVAQRPQASMDGPDPGWIYVVRSGGHATGYYKVGKTRRNPSHRARELSSATGVPTPFEELYSCPTGDVSAAEAEVHRRLDRFRVSKRREFFRAPLSVIVETVNTVVAEYEREEAD